MVSWTTVCDSERVLLIFGKGSVVIMFNADLLRLLFTTAAETEIKIAKKTSY